MTRRRKLRPEEEALWDIVARRAEPLRKPRVPEAEPDRAPPPTPSIDPRPALPKFRIGEGAEPPKMRDDILPGLSDRLAANPVQMDRKAFTRMKRGRLAPEDRIDLHGMTLSEAHPALISFILSSQAAGLRLVLVITGKGKNRDDGGPIPTRFGVLRHQVPQWLAMPPLSQAVLEVRESHRKHGGQGALYVYQDAEKPVEGEMWTDPAVLSYMHITALVPVPEQAA